MEANRSMKPWRKVVVFSQFVNGFEANGRMYPGWLALNRQESKLSYAIKRVLAQIEKFNSEKVIEFDNIDIDNCATDANQVILRNPDTTLAFTKEGLKARNLARTELLDKEVEIEPYYATELPDTLRPEEREILTGFVIKEEDAKLSAVA